MSQLGSAGRSRLRVEGRAKLTGRAAYVADVRLPGMLFAHLVLSPHAHARIRRVETAAARRVPGVAAVLVDGDLGGRGLLAREEVLYAGEPVVTVVAESEGVAEDAAGLVRVDYEPLPALVDPLAAMKPGAPAVRPATGRAWADEAGAHGAGGQAGVRGSDTPNITQTVRYCRGNLDRGWSQADTILEDTYRAAWVHQGYLEPQGAVAAPSGDGGVTVWASTQGLFFARGQVARLLGLPESRVRVVPLTVGGGFGGKTCLLEPLVAALALHLGRPVRLVLDRHQDFLLSHAGPGAVIQLRMGARRDGTLTALRARLVFDTGAAPGAPVGLAALLLASTYRVPNLEVTGYEVLTHKAPSGAYRAPGAPQAYFALESHLDRLARRLKADPLELRLRNGARPGDERADGRPWPEMGLIQCLERAREHPMWTGRRRARGSGEGYGLAAGGWPGGLEPAAAGCRLDGDGTLTIQVGAVDLTGSHTTFALMAAEVFGLPVERVRVVTGDTDQAPFAGMSSGSKTIYTTGLAVLRAAEDARRQALEVASDYLEVAPEDLELAGGRVSVRGAPARGIGLDELARLTLQYNSRYAPVHGHARVVQREAAPGFAAHVARVQVDPGTGRLRVTGYLAVQDVGRALNPAEVLGQIRGGVAQGIGRALLEELAFDEQGHPVTATFADYPLPGARDVPPIQVELVEVPAPTGPWGARGVGEPPVVPCAAAIANALEDAVGARVTRLPLRPEAVLAALEQGRRGGP